ncbi:MAG: DEAD/DEAH box helicase, partial [Myxococcales bacterium]|nr:DEAD/DEAH box helicase [Myxococcales bacterium]
MTTPIDVFESLRADFFRYYGTPYRLRYPHIESERRELLDTEGSTWREPWIEPVVEYRLSGLGVDQALRDAGGDADLAEFVKCGLIGYPDIFRHQAASLAAVRTGKNVVVTAGTGSGKTESFLLPVVDALLMESRSWTGSSPAGERWWAIKDAQHQAQRAREHGRLPGVRALILYPMNALVEDQLVRLRRALDSDAARQWLKTNRGGHRFYFGRYTGATPVSGRRVRSTKTTQLKRALVDAEERFDAWRHDEEKRYFLQSLDGAEMRCRWDMQAHAPDLLITNYSMLNIMLLRDIEHGMFEQTRRWLESDPNNVFHLVVDELHMYRGTSGTEVAFLVRNLLNRLGLHPDSPQVRFIATSASLGGDAAGRTYLTEFFGAAGSSFELLEGERVVPDDPPVSLERFADIFTAWGVSDDAIDGGQALEVLAESRAKDAISAAAERSSDLAGQTV